MHRGGGRRGRKKQSHNNSTNNYAKRKDTKTVSKKRAIVKKQLGAGFLQKMFNSPDIDDLSVNSDPPSSREKQLLTNTRLPKEQERVRILVSE